MEKDAGTSEESELNVIYSSGTYSTSHSDFKASTFNPNSVSGSSLKPGLVHF
jgi:hypothetical protein